MLFRIVVLLLCGGLLGGTGAQAAEDDVLTAIGEATAQYRKGDFAAAAGSLDYAAQLVRQKKGEQLKTLLPKPLPGWEAGEANAQAVGAAMFGGAVNVSREYHKGESNVGIEVVTDSPMLQSVMMMLNNPMFAGASGGKMETISGQRAIVNYDQANRSGEINVVVANRFMVTIRGRQTTREEMLAYAKAMDYARLAASP